MDVRLPRNTKYEFSSKTQIMFRHDGMNQETGIQDFGKKKDVIYNSGKISIDVNGGTEQENDTC